MSKRTVCCFVVLVGLTSTIGQTPFQSNLSACPAQMVLFDDEKKDPAPEGDCLLGDVNL